MIKGFIIYFKKTKLGALESRVFLTASGMRYALRMYERSTAEVYFKPTVIPRYELDMMTKGLKEEILDEQTKPNRAPALIGGS